jgi:hypothetical protein
MNELMTCSGCGGFRHATADVCPHCDAPPPRSRRRLAILAGLAGSASLGLTMMACYGGPPCGSGLKCALPDGISDASGDANGADGGAD